MKKAFIYGSLLCAAAVSRAELVKIDLPVETATYRKAPGSEVANSQCLTCHSADYAAMQPPMSGTFWKAEVEKMAAKYGAPIPTNQVDTLTAYFTANYGVTTNAAAISSKPSAPVIAPTAITGKIDGLTVATKMGCLNCHGTDHKIIGPAYRDVALKYKNNPAALERIEHQITHGGSGQWGVVPMPPYDQLSSAEIKAVGEWIMNQAKK
jgi:cytochrome c551/c552